MLCYYSAMMSREQPGGQPAGGKDNFRVRPEVRGFIAQMDEAMRRPEYFNVVVPMQLAIGLWRIGKISSFADFERGLRDMGSPVNFIAMPPEALRERWSVVPVNDWEQLEPEAMAPAQTANYKIVYPSEVKTHGQPDYYLWTGLHGSEEAAKMKRRLGVTDEENLTRLKTTGLLGVQSPEEL